MAPATDPWRAVCSLSQTGGRINAGRDPRWSFPDLRDGPAPGRSSPSSRRDAVVRRSTRPDVPAGARFVAAGAALCVTITRSWTGIDPDELAEDAPCRIGAVAPKPPEIAVLLIARRTFGRLLHPVLRQRSCAVRKDAATRGETSRCARSRAAWRGCSSRRVRHRKWCSQVAGCSMRGRQILAAR